LTETVEKTATGAIVYDKTLINQISDECFTPEGWLHAEAVSGRLRSAGRGNTMFIGNVPRQFVLRHYLRGGMVGRWVRDRYFFTGADRTRSFMEWRLLQKLSIRQMRVPQPVAARYCRHGMSYTADIITVRLRTVVSLSEHIAGNGLGVEFWHELGKAIREFHAAGVYHADMNAYNLQIDKDGRLWMLDFDKGALRPPGPWQQQSLQRLQRSLLKISRLDRDVQFRPGNWEELLKGYFEASRSA